MINIISNIVTVKVSGKEIERLLNMCNYHNLKIWDLKNFNNDYIFEIYANDYYRLCKISKKTQMKIKILQKKGISFWLFKIKKRKLFLIGLILGILFLLFLSLHIWNIKIIGNQKQSRETLISYLMKHGIYNGMWKKDVSCNRIECILREDFSDFTWVSVSIEGTCLLIEIKENTYAPVISNYGTDLVSSKDGIIASIITRRGIPLVHKGEKTKKGDILVSGEIPLINDSGEIVKYIYVNSDADIYIKSKEAYHEQLCLNQKSEVYTGKEKREFYIRIFGYTINLGTYNVNCKKYRRITFENQVKLGHTFYLPIWYGKIIYKEFYSKNITYPKEYIEDLLQKEFQQYCRNLNEKGVEITENSVKIHVDNDLVVMSGNLIVRWKEELTKATSHQHDITKSESNEQ